MTKLTEQEKEFIEAVKKMDYNKGGSFVISTKNNIYHGIPFETPRGCIHGEENAIGTMVTAEGLRSRFKIILVVGSPEEIIMPCGICREAIRKYGIKDVVILCSTKDLTKIEKFTLHELLPLPSDKKWL